MVDPTPMSDADVVVMSADEIEREFAELCALSDAATPGPWRADFMLRTFQRVRQSPGDLAFNTKPEADRHDAAFIAAAPRMMTLLRALHPQGSTVVVGVAELEGLRRDAARWRWVASKEPEAFGIMERRIDAEIGAAIAQQQGKHDPAES